MLFLNADCISLKLLAEWAFSRHDGKVTLRCCSGLLCLLPLHPHWGRQSPFPAGISLGSPWGALPGPAELWCLETLELSGASSRGLRHGGGCAECSCEQRPHLSVVWGSGLSIPLVCEQSYPVIGYCSVPTTSSNCTGSTAGVTALLINL